MRQGVDWRNSEWDPVPEGTVRERLFEDPESGQHYEVAIRWIGGGWTQIVGFRIGQLYAEGATYRRAKGAKDMVISPEHLPDTLANPIPAGTIGSVATAVEHWFEVYAATQRVAMVWRDVDDGALDRVDALTELGGQPFEMLRNGKSEGDDVAIAASLYRFFSELGSRKPTEDVAQATQVSRATSARRIKDARARDLLGEARVGAAGEFKPSRRIR